MLFEVLFVRFVREFCHVYRHIVHVDCEPLFSDFWGESGVHHCLEGCWGVCESEKHNCWFEQAFIRHKCCFPFVSFLDTNIVVPPSDVEFSIEGASSESINKLWNEWERVFVLYRPVVNWSIILDRSQFAVFLFDKEK